MIQTKFSSHPVKAPNNRHEFSLAGLAGMLALAMAMSAQIAPRPALAAIADVPLYLTSPVEPNIMFVIDDSGSMHFELMPDGLILNDARYVFPRASEVYGTSDYTNRAPTVDNNAPYNALSRSPQVNKLYYNPSITYTPWIKHDNTLYPNATPESAYHNPEKTSAGSRNLTADNTHNISWTSCTSSNEEDDCSNNTTSKTFWPATYFWHNSGDIWTWGNYTKVEIKSTTASYSGDGRENRTDCAGNNVTPPAVPSGICTYDEEIQNFANWYTYYRSRILAARAGIGRAFAQQGEDVRVGFGAINYTTTGVDGVSTGTVVRGVRKFTTGMNRQNFFSDLYTRNIPASGTPLRRALNEVGQYYSSSDNSGPWGADPGTNDATAHLECRQSYTVLMTDGYWSGGSSYQASTSAARENVDGAGGPTITGPGSASFTYSAVSPFTDSYENTLADVAMYYWKNDLRSGLDNEVPTSDINPAFWQHMVTFGVGLGVTGTVNPTDAFNAITSEASIPWPYTEPGTGNCGDSANPDDICPARIDDLLHASVNSRGGFFSASDPNTFATKLAAVLDSITDRTASSSAVASNSTRMSSLTHLYQALFKSGDWSGQLKAFPLLEDDADTVEDEGGTVGPEAWDAADGIPDHDLRIIKTWNGSAGTDFLGALGGLSAAQVNYLRGDFSGEEINGGTFRNRRSNTADEETKLGDIINSDPHYVKNENFGYNTLPGAEGTSYSTFVNDKSSRTAMIYAGANDGMLHGFDTATGQEKLAYVPYATWLNLPLLTNPGYTHKYFVDGSPTAWDAYLGSSWKTVLVGSLGAGGNAVYALDVSNPDTFGNSNVLWEFTHADMGYVMGNVTIARFADDNYWAVFGNGYASTSGKAVLFMVRVDAPGTVKMIEVDNAGNGLSTPTLVDSNGDRIIDMIYAGDLKGNIWKFDVSGFNTATWKSAYLASSTPEPLFTAKDGLGDPQPITSPPEVGLAPSGASGLMVYFGTGKYFETGDQSTITVQTMYGIVDSGSAFGTTGNNRDQLVLQSIIYEGTVGGNAVRVISDNPVTYPGDKGWFIDLLTPPSSTAKGERVISAPRLFGGRLLFQSIIPSLSPCDNGGASWLMQVNPATGGQLLSASFDIDGNNLFNSYDQIDIGEGVMANASGVDYGVGISGGFGSPISAGGTAFVPLSGTGDPGTVDVEPPKVPKILGSSLKPRASWRQIQ